jgi:hypothetical protein
MCDIGLCSEEIFEEWKRWMNDREQTIHKNPCDKHGAWDGTKYYVCPKCWFGEDHK